MKKQTLRVYSTKEFSKEELYSFKLKANRTSFILNNLLKTTKNKVILLGDFKQNGVIKYLTKKGAKKAA